MAPFPALKHARLMPPCRPSLASCPWPAGEGKQLTFKMGVGVALALTGFTMYSQTKIKAMKSAASPPTPLASSGGSGGGSGSFKALPMADMDAASNLSGALNVKPS